MDTSGLPRWPVATFLQPLNDDTDGDGLSDEWERHYFGSLAASATGIGANGRTNFYNYAFGDSPTSGATSCDPHMLTSGAQKLFEFWRLRPELPYSVELSTDLQLWQPAPFTLQPGAAHFQLDLSPLGQSRAFLRVGAGL